MTIIDIIGYIPAIIFPVATLSQLFHLLKTKSADGVSLITWIAFATGNVSLYIYTEKYNELQTIAGLLLTAILQIAIVVLILKYRRPKPVRVSEKKSD
ncbi:hypothetical protein VA7868_03327 [Vibrio aerogenes CECT 7868]|uniref:PQ loop repeat protein n=1 Tax=Vibrio aerogenes CECT 7868 TaxID=1216006 RepID=A0A1M5ZX45_9VIBR|nr:hypothetical protein [Vibrio aerogenes]SHI28473.1 hypothetical protein VA7868_03327 [Vibrio aerogenes CECT 7868]